MSVFQIQTKREVVSNTYEINAISIKIGEVVLGKSAVIYTDFLNNNGSIIKTTMDKLEQPEYGNWGTNDNYIVDWVCRKYAITKTSVI